MQASKSMQNKADQIRKQFSTIESNKSAIADGAIAGATEAVKGFGNVVTILEGVTKIYRAVEKAGQVIAKDEGIRQKVKALVENTVSNVVSRANEVAGILDYCSKSASITAIIEEVSATKKEVSKTVRKMKSSRKLFVVTDEEFHKSRQFQDFCREYESVVTADPDARDMCYEAAKESLLDIQERNPEIHVDIQECLRLLTERLDKAQDEGEKRH